MATATQKFEGLTHGKRYMLVIEEGGEEIKREYGVETLTTGQMVVYDQATDENSEDPKHRFVRRDMEDRNILSVLLVPNSAVSINEDTVTITDGSCINYSLIAASGKLNESARIEYSRLIKLIDKAYKI